MLQRLGDVAWRAVLRDHERITRESLQAHGGTEVKTMGDGFMASFDSATSAVECAIELQRAFAVRNTTSSEPMLVRVGLNAGEPIEEDDDLFGTAVTMAARIMGQGSGGEILVSDVIRALVAGKGFLFSDRGEFVPKGFDEGVRLWDVRWQD
jgi:class 3 adenylate cyclase